MKITAPISVGELFDKISVLEIKEKEFTAADHLFLTSEIAYSLRHIGFEKKALLDQAEPLWSGAVDTLYQELKKVNKQIWLDVDEMHRVEFAWFKNPFKIAELGRRIARVNDERAAIKRKLNEMFNSEIVEEKLYR